MMLSLEAHLTGYRELAIAATIVIINKVVIVTQGIDNVKAKNPPEGKAATVKIP